MGILSDTEAAYYDKEEKVIPETNKMGLVQALTILHHFRDLQESYDLKSDVVDALNVIFEWIDNAVLLLHRLGSRSGSPPE